MPDAILWGFVALIAAPQILMLFLTFAPKSFWRNLHKQHPYWAFYLWGFSHMFGPSSAPGHPPPWERLP